MNWCRSRSTTTRPIRPRTAATGSCGPSTTSTTTSWASPPTPLPGAGAGAFSWNATSTPPTASGRSSATAGTPADLNGDGRVDQLDDDLMDNYVGSSSEAAQAGDMDADGDVDADDVAIFDRLVNWAGYTGVNDRAPAAFARRDRSARYTNPGGLWGIDQPYGLCRIGHQGLAHDEETGLIHNRARIRSPRLGRFLQPDISHLNATQRRWRVGRPSRYHRRRASKAFRDDPPHECCLHRGQSDDRRAKQSVGGLRATAGLHVSRRPGRVCHAEVLTPPVTRVRLAGARRIGGFAAGSPDTSVAGSPPRPVGTSRIERGKPSWLRS